MQTLWIARHANRQDFADPTWAETADRPHDPGLSSDGQEQARQLARRVADLGLDRIVASPFLRAVQTAHHAAKAANLSVFLEPGLGEWENPHWFDSPPHPLPFSTLADQYPRLANGHAPCRQPSYPESKDESLARLGTAGQCLARRYEDDTLLLVGHGITVLGVLHGLVGENVSDPGCPLASLTQVTRRDGAWHIETRNDTTHLDDGAHSADRLA